MRGSRPFNTRLLDAIEAGEAEVVVGDDPVDWPRTCRDRAVDTSRDIGSHGTDEGCLLVGVGLAVVPVLFGCQPLEMLVLFSEGRLATQLVTEVEGLPPPWMTGFDKVQVRDAVVTVGQNVHATPRAQVQLRRYQLPSRLGEDRIGRFAVHQ